MITSIKIIKNLIIYIILPLLVASVLSLFILNFMGVKLPEKVRDILPSSAVAGDIKEIDNEKVKSLEITVEEQQEKIESLEVTIAEKDNQLNELSSQIEGFRKSANEEITTSSETSEEENKHVLNIIKEMRAKDAAAIILSMENQEASSLLTKLDKKLVAEILAEIEPEQAAEYLQLMKQ
jgi:flagellar motility protein MotE (MotC chaperone)